MPLIYPTQDPRHFDRRLYKGGDGGAGQMRQDEQDRQSKVQAAVDSINAKFGIAPTSGAMETVLGATPTRDQFTQIAQAGRYVEQNDGTGDNSTTTWVPATQTTFNEAGYNAALADYEARKAQIYGGSDSAAAAGQAKAGRESMYTDIAGAVRDTAMRDLDRQYSQASQRNTFGLARNGLLGGSVDAESGGELSTLYGEGKLKATQAGQAAASELRGNDEKTRQNLIGLAQSGLDTGTASSMAAGQMASAADLAKSQSAGASVGRLFDDMSQAYVNSQYLKSRYPSGTQQQPASGYGTSVFSPSRYVGVAGS